jgi:hypothetical protein
MRSSILAALVACSCVACSSSSSDSQASGPPPSDTKTPDAPASERLSLKVGDVADLTVTDGKAGAALATGGGAEEYVVVLASTRFDASGALAPWSVTTGAVPEGAKAQIASSCSIARDAWRGKTVAAETPPTCGRTSRRRTRRRSTTRS